MIYLGCPESFYYIVLNISIRNSSLAAFVSHITSGGKFISGAASTDFSGCTLGKNVALGP